MGEYFPIWNADQAPKCINPLVNTCTVKNNRWHENIKENRYKIESVTFTLHVGLFAYRQQEDRDLEDDGWQ